MKIEPQTTSALLTSTTILAYVKTAASFAYDRRTPRDRSITTSEGINMSIVTIGSKGHVYAWDFKFEVVPTPPTGFNEPTNPYDPIDVHAGKVELVDKYSPEFSSYLLANVVLSGGWGEIGQVLSGFDDGKYSRNVEHAPLKEWTKKYGKPPTSIVFDYSVLGRWVQLFTHYNQGNAFKKEYETTVGSTESTEVFAKIGAKIGASATASGGVPGFGEVSASICAEVSAETGISHAVSYSKSVTVKEIFEIPAHTYVQAWQFEVGVKVDGDYLWQRTPNYQSLTWPH